MDAFAERKRIFLFRNEVHRGFFKNLQIITKKPKQVLSPPKSPNSFISTFVFVCDRMSSASNMKNAGASAAGLKVDFNSTTQTPSGAMTRQSQALSSVINLFIWL